VLRIVLRATWPVGKIENKASAPHPSLGLLPNGVRTCILVFLCPRVVPIAFFLECPWQPSFQRLFVVSERGNYAHFFENGCPELV
jgi:hypothetical protein